MLSLDVKSQIQLKKFIKKTKKKQKNLILKQKAIFTLKHKAKHIKQKVNQQNQDQSIKNKVKQKSLKTNF